MAHSASIIIFIAVLAMFLLQVPHVSHAKRYDLTPGYVFTNNAALQGSSDTKAGYRILTTESNETIVSGNGTSAFALAFYDPKKNGEYFLSVLLTVGKSKSASLAVPVWTANFNASVSDGATLMLTKNHQKLILLDGSASGSLRWNSGLTDIKGIELTESGNLRLYGDEEDVLWESFNHPTNILVPQQVLRTDMSVMSVNTSGSGKFVGAVEASGFVLYVVPQSEVNMANILRKPQPYQVWSIFGTAPGTSFESAKRSCETSNATLAFTTNKLVVSYEQRSGCGPASVIFEQPGGDNTASQFMRLEENGDLVVYEFGEDVETWKSVFNLSQKATDSCKLPTACGSYGFCSRVGECSCIRGSNVGPESESGVCTRPNSVSISCLTNEVDNHHFVRVKGATYFSTRVMEADKEKVSEDDCLSLCVSNCSCAAAFYKEKSRSCYLVEELTGSMTVEPSESDSTGFVKFQNDHLTSEPLGSRSRRTTSKAARTAIIFLAILTVCLTVTLVGVIWLVKTKYPHAYNKIMRRK